MSEKIDLRPRNQGKWIEYINMIVSEFVKDLKKIRGFEYIYDDQTLVGGINKIIKKWEEKLK